MAAPRKRTDALVKEVKDLRAIGCTWKEISEQTGHSTSTLRYWVDPRYRKQVEAARERRRKAQKSVHKSHQRITEESIVQFLHENGPSYTFAIKDRLGIPQGTVGFLLHGLKQSGKIVHVSRGLYALPEHKMATVAHIPGTKDAA